MLEAWSFSARCAAVVDVLRGREEEGEGKVGESGGGEGQCGMRLHLDWGSRHDCVLCRESSSRGLGENWKRGV